mgnify:CR=1 FL=1
MNELAALLSIGVIGSTVALNKQSQNNEVVYVKANHNGKSYLVRNVKDKQEAADLLAQIGTNLQLLVDYVYENDRDKDGATRMKRKYNGDNISESEPNTKYTSYSVNKGEKIVFCLRSKDDKQELSDLNLMMFVAIHELAHVMTKSVGHTEEFWDNFRYLLKKAMKLNIYKRHDFKNKPRSYCGTTITESPLDYD